MKPRYAIGIDEVGRGPIAGPVTVCAVLVKGDDGTVPSGLRAVRDSKQLSPARREELFMVAREAERAGHITSAVASVGPRVIDAVGLSVALRRALIRALMRVMKKRRLSPTDVRVLLDGALHAPLSFPHQETIIKGDASVPLISLASVIAKVTRDRTMVLLSQNPTYAPYHFEKHKGYGTREHYTLLAKHGVSDMHRMSTLHWRVSD